MKPAMRRFQRQQANALEANAGELAAPDDGGPMRIKTILQELAEEVRIDARNASNRRS